MIEGLPTNARTLLEGWRGRTIATVSQHRPNRILDVRDGTVLVETGSSPNGEEVPLEMVQDALDRLHADHRVRVDVPTLGHRSAFCGAVLNTLPGVWRNEGRRQTVRWHGPRRAVVVTEDDRSSEVPWGDGDPRERFWLEAADRRNRGADLHCVRRDSASRTVPGRSAITFVRAGDVVFHYDTAKSRREIVSWSRAVGPLESAPLDGRPGWAFDLEGPFLLTPPVRFAELRERADAILDAQPVSVPFTLRRDGRFSLAERYLTKLPAAVVELLELERGALPAAPATQPIGRPWQPPRRPRSGKSPRALTLAFEAIERGTRAHYELELALADALVQRGLVPRGAEGSDPRFDLGWEAAGAFHVAELKSLTDGNAERQLRLGLGQVLRYRHLLAGRRDGAVRAVLVTERPVPDQSWHEVCAGAGVTLIEGPDLAAGLAGLHDA